MARNTRANNPPPDDGETVRRFNEYTTTVTFRGLLVGDGYQLTVRYTEFVTANGDKGVDVAIKTTPATGLVPAGMPTTLLRTLNRLIALSIVAVNAEDSDEGVHAFAHTYVMLSRKITRALAACARSKNRCSCNTRRVHVE